MKKLLLSLVLTLAISGLAFAGDIPTSDYVPPPPTQPATMSSDSNVTSTDMSDSDYTELSIESLEPLLLSLVGMMFR